MIQVNPTINWITFTKLVEISERLHREDFPSPPPRLRDLRVQVISNLRELQLVRRAPSQLKAKD